MHEYTHAPGFIDNECMDRGQMACLLSIHTCVTLACVLIAVTRTMVTCKVYIIYTKHKYRHSGCTYTHVYIFIHT